MTKDTAELFVDDVKLIARGIERFLDRVEASPDLRAKSLPEVVMDIQRTGALDNVTTDLLGKILDKIPPGMLQNFAETGEISIELDPSIAIKH